jgi:hypothetical protein
VCRGAGGQHGPYVVFEAVALLIREGARQRSSTVREPVVRYNAVSRPAGLVRQVAFVELEHRVLFGRRPDPGAG